MTAWKVQIDKCGFKSLGYFTVISCWEWRKCMNYSQLKNYSPTSYANLSSFLLTILSLDTERDVLESKLVTKVKIKYISSPKLCILQSPRNLALHTGMHISNDLGSKYILYYWLFVSYLVGVFFLLLNLLKFTRKVNLVFTDPLLNPTATDSHFSVTLCLWQPHWNVHYAWESIGKAPTQIWASLSTKAPRLHKLQKNIC